MMNLILSKFFHIKNAFWGEGTKKKELARERFSKRQKFWELKVSEHLEMSNFVYTRDQSK